MNPSYQVWLTTLDSVKLYQSMTDTDYDAVLTDLIEQASMDIMTFLQRIPLPRIETRVYDWTREYLTDNAMGLVVDDDLLSVTTLTNGDSTTIANTNYTLKPNNQYPKNMIFLNWTSYLNFVPSPAGNTSQVISVAGQWGYVPQYGREWLDSGVNVPAGGITSSATTVTLGAGQAAAFAIGDYIKIDSEYLQVIGRNTTTDVLTLSRAELGTTAAAHDVGADIYIYQQLRDIVRACNEQVTFLFKTRDNVGQQIQIYDGVTRVTQGLSPEVRKILFRHQRLQIVGM